jgi:hypothetical protein
LKVESKEFEKLLLSFLSNKEVRSALGECAALQTTTDNAVPAGETPLRH